MARIKKTKTDDNSTEIPEAIQQALDQSREGVAAPAAPEKKESLADMFKRLEKLGAEVKAKEAEAEKLHSEIAILTEQGRVLHKRIKEEMSVWDEAEEEAAPAPKTRTVKAAKAGTKSGSWDADLATEVILSTIKGKKGIKKAVILEQLKAKNLTAAPLTINALITSLHEAKKLVKDGERAAMTYRDPSVR